MRIDIKCEEEMNQEYWLFLEEMLYTHYISNSRRTNAVMCKAHWEDVSDQPRYGLWINYSKIKKLILSLLFLITYTCFKIK